MESKQQPIPNEEEFKIMADYAPVMIWISGVDKLRYFFNAGWLRFTGRTMDKELGNGWTEIVHPIDLAAYLNLYNASFEARKPFKIEYRLKRYDGNYHWVVASGVPRYSPTGEFIGYVGSCMDINELVETERVKKELMNTDALQKEQALNEELAATNEELAAINEEQAASNEEFLATNEELQHSRESLAALNNQLEERIAQRTKDLEESEQMAMSLVKGAPFPIGVYVGKEKRILMANQSIMDVWGKGNDVGGKLYTDILPELDNQEIFNQIDTVFNTGIPFHAKHERVDLVIDNKLQSFYFNYSFTPLIDSRGEVYGVMNTAAEVTDLVVAKQQVEKNQENLHNMILQAPVAMCILLGPAHVITVANQLMVDLWGKRAEDVMNKPVFEALPDASGQGLEELMHDVYHGASFKASEMPVTLLRNGKEDVVYQNFVYEPYKDSDGNILGIIAITIDVTEQVLARKKIEQSEAELLLTKERLELELEAGKQLQRQKDDFIGIASHELKTPLTSITAIVQLLNRKLKDHPDPFIAGAMMKANVQVQKMISLINGFLNVSRLESGKLLIDKQEFNIDKLIVDVIDEVNLTTMTHTINLIKCDAIPVFADKDKIEIVLSNLLSNAIKYSPKGKYIEVNCTVNNGFVEISVKDEGMGVKPEDMDKLFDRYYRVEASHTKDISGFGIGLYLSAEIIHHHGGKIWVDSREGEGSTFYFTLPIFS
jgi:PAS domain S-box-containing protein